MTEWFDNSDPPGYRLDNEDLDLDWSELQPGVRVRWKTPNFVRRGVITSLAGRSMTLRFDGFTEDTVIPDGKWYWVQAKLGNRQEHMIAIPSDPDQNVWDYLDSCGELGDEPEGSDFITPSQAANIIGTDPKVVRRMIRTGTLPASRKGGRWVILRSDALAHRR